MWWWGENPRWEKLFDGLSINLKLADPLNNMEVLR